jgi:(2Fe-2S) ferredoxin
MKISTEKDLEKLKKQGLASLFPERTKIMVGAATCGVATGANDLLQALQTALSQKRLNAVVKKTGCIGLCHHEPLVDLIIPGKPRLTYGRMTPEKASGILDTLRQKKMPKGAVGKMVEEPFLLDDTTKSFIQEALGDDLSDITNYSSLPFYNKQKKIALRNCGFIDPENICEYIAKGGYFALARTLADYSPRKLISQIDRQCR